MPLRPLLVMLAGITLLLVLGMLIRRNGPRGLVHGLGDWNRFDAATRLRVGHVMGNVMFAMAALLAGFAFYGYSHFADKQQMHMAALLLKVGIGGLGIGLILYLRFMGAKRPDV